MQSLELKWDDGEVGDYWLCVGLNYKCVHVYQTPWSGTNWWVDGLIFGLDKETYYSLIGAMDAAECAVERWMSKAVYRSPKPMVDGDYGEDELLL